MKNHFDFDDPKHAFNLGKHSDKITRYEDGPRRFVPGYELSHTLASILLRDRIGERGKILVLGAGGGVELAAFGQAAPDWTFVGIDPSENMLSQAKDKLRDLHLDHRVELVKGYIPDAPEGPFDAATCFLTLHFIPDDGSRLDTLRHIHERLAPGAPFILINFCADKTAPSFEDQLRLYRAYPIHQGLPVEMAEHASRSVTELVPLVPPEREVALLQEAGFEDVTLFYKAFLFNGWIVRKA
ncbi:class I SAM-dependent methyltransferase [Chondromyces crocatus]|uniref:Methyltransferase n=1 Tax=Chondromyces crocatus TaxID=52 RepID=A0A0K1EMF9_CHOCO|nr:class I SAM-dependent methyltransferase [Chondromyces crocatus]AKT42075.1 methyltransferase [Chondromyces crocatus]